ncbi:DUF3159 domain-containing protein [Timonella sp. A28]|uniref:DUF3159 domain-containing protein n=1 Tax=Timonella sp. A28 TaxID=3442640 RepID=UPI003EB8D6E9
MPHTPDENLVQPAEATEEAPKRGVNSLTAQEFDALASVGGIRGLIEAVAPGLIYLIVYLTTKDLAPALVLSLGVALTLVVIRLVQRTQVTMAFSGIFGVLVGLFIAWKSGEASDFYAPGLLINIAYLLALVVSVIVRWPGVGVLVELLKSGFGVSNTAPKTTEEETPALKFPTQWRKNPSLLKRYTLVTWLWIGLFAARLAVQGPLYLAGDSAIGMLGTARIVMGLPLFALVLWLSWRIIRQPESVEDPQE